MRLPATRHSPERTHDRQPGLGVAMRTGRRRRYAASRRTCPSGVRDEVLGLSAPGTWWTCAPPTSTPVVCSPPAHLPQGSPSGPAIPTAINVPWSRPPTRRGHSSPTVVTHRAVRRPRDRPPSPYCRIGSAPRTPGRADELLGRHDVKNYDGIWTETAPGGRADRPGDTPGGK